MKLCFEYLFLSFSLKFVARFVWFSNCASLHLATDWLLGVAGFRRRAKTDSGERGLIFFESYLKKLFVIRPNQAVCKPFLGSFIKAKVVITSLASNHFKLVISDLFTVKQ